MEYMATITKLEARPLFGTEHDDSDGIHVATCAACEHEIYFTGRIWRHSEHGGSICWEVGI